jgi:hypothetical protein
LRWSFDTLSIAFFCRAAAFRSCQPVYAGPDAGKKLAAQTAATQPPQHIRCREQASLEKTY